MLTFYADPFIRAVNTLAFLSGQIGIGLARDKTLGIHQVSLEGLAAPLEEFEKAAAEMPLSPVVKARIGRIQKRLLSHDTTLSEFETLLAELQHDILVDLSSNLFLMVMPERQELYSQTESLFGSAVARRFPSATFDIEEAGKCVALDRGTASVFHLMRVMEVGLRVLGKSLNDPSLDPATNPSWDKILTRCRKELEKPLAQRSVEWKSDGEFYSGTAARLMAAKDAWRNPTMHVGQKYTEEEALDVWNHVRAFMMQIATKLSE